MHGWPSSNTSMIGSIEAKHDPVVFMRVVGRDPFSAVANPDRRTSVRCVTSPEPWNRWLLRFVYKKKFFFLLFRPNVSKETFLFKSGKICVCKTNKSWSSHGWLVELKSTRHVKRGWGKQSSQGTMILAAKIHQGNRRKWFPTKEVRV